MFRHFYSILIIISIFIAPSAFSQDKNVIERHKKILLEKFPDAKFKNIEVDTYKGKEIYEYEFEFQDKSYEAFITPNDNILRLGLD